MEKTTQKKSLLQKGSITFLVGFCVNMAFMLIGIGGLLREVARLTALIGLLLIVIGFVQKVINKLSSKGK